METEPQFEYRPPGPWMYGAILAIASLLFVLGLLQSCSPRIVETIKTETLTEVRDSVAWRDTTIYVSVPLEADQAIVHVGDTSHRETSVAESDAWVDADGFLHHDLRNKPWKLPYQVSLPERYLVSTVTNTKEEAHIITREVKVEKKLNLWQRFRIGAFWWLLGLVLFAYRKQLLAAIKKAFGHY